MNCECKTWCRSDSSKPATDHHYNCDHVDESLMTVWYISLDDEGDGFYTDCDIVVHEYGKADDEGHTYMIVERKMHREIFERLEEHEGS